MTFDKQQPSIQTLEHSKRSANDAYDQSRDDSALIVVEAVEIWSYPKWRYCAWKIVWIQRRVHDLYSGLW